MYIVLAEYDPNASYSDCVNVIVFIIDESTFVDSICVPAILLFLAKCYISCSAYKL